MQACVVKMNRFVVALLAAALPQIVCAQVITTGLARTTLRFPDGNLAAFTVGEAAQGNTDLNGDGDATDHVLHLFDLATNTATNVGLYVGSGARSFELDGNRVAFSVPESGQANTDLNGDGDTTDLVLHVYDAATNTTTNVGVSVDSTEGLRLDGDLVAFIVHEGREGNTDLNGDGDNVADLVIHLYNIATNTVTNLGFDVGSQFELEGNRVVFHVSEAGQGFTDLNGDGDALDELVHIYDAAANTITKVDLDASGGFRYSGNSLAFLAIESRQGNTDLNGDGDTLDRVLHTYNLATNTITNVGLAATGLAVGALDGELVAIAVRESDQGNTDLNGDGDTSDFVLHVRNIATNTTTNVGLNTSLIHWLDGDVVAFTVSEAAEGATDLNGDGDTNDVVVHVYNAATDTTTNVGFVATTGVQLDGNLVAFAVSEGAQGGIDLNGDGDALDLVFHVFDAATLTTTSVGVATFPGPLFLVEGSLVAFTAREASQGNTDLNGDGDTSDFAILHVYDAATDTTTNLGRDATGGLFLAGNVVVFAVSEANQGNTILNGDADTTDFVVHLYRHATSPNTAPQITCPADTTFNCAPAAGQAVSIQVTVTDPDADHLIVTLEDAGGILATEELDGPAANELVTFDTVTLLPGVHDLTVTVDDGQTTASCETTVTVNADTEPPEITCPADIAVNATSPAGATVNYPPATVTDNCSVVAACAPESGTVFAIGDTTVECVAMDTAGNESACSFNVHVKGALEQISDLCALIKNFGTNQGTANALCVKLNDAAAHLAAGRDAAACQKMQDFINEIEAQRGKKLTGAQADLLISEATRIRAVIGCS